MIIIHDRGLNDIGAVAEELPEILKSDVCELLSGILEETGREITASKAMRKADGLKVKERNVNRRLLTSPGEIHLLTAKVENFFYESDHIAEWASAKREERTP